MMKKIFALLFCLLPSLSQAQIVGTLPFQLQNNTTADATQVMADFNKILNDVNANGAKNGVNTDITALTALTIPLTTLQGGSTIYIASTSGGTANAQTVATPTPTGFTLAVGKRVTFIAGSTNTAAMQLNVNSTGLTNVFRYTPAGPVALTGGEVVAGNYIEAVYDGTRFILYTNAATPWLGPSATLASAATTDLGTITNHNILVSGTATVTSFGSTALTTYPLYQLKFSGAATLTHNATSLILPGTSNIVTAANDSATALYLGSGNWQVLAYSKANGSALGQVNTATTLTAASGTYTLPANVRWIDVKLVGAGGGGGGGQNAAAAGTGGTTCFALSGAACSSPILSVNGGLGGSAPNPGTGGGGTIVGGFNAQIGASGTPSGPPGTGYNAVGGTGGSSCVGGGTAGSPGNATAANANANSGAGAGGGGATNGTLTGSGGAGGGGGGCLFALINAPVATYTYAIGAAGTAGSASSSSSSSGGAGGAGGTGRIEIIEHY